MSQTPVEIRFFEEVAWAGLWWETGYGGGQFCRKNDGDSSSESRYPAQLPEEVSP